MNPLMTLLLGLLVTGVTELMKKVLPKVNPLLWVALLALIGGFLYGIVIPLLPHEVVEKAVYSFGIAVGFYEILMQFVPAKTTKKKKKK